MQALLKKELQIASLTEYGSGGSGAICQGQGYSTDRGRIYVKMNSKHFAMRMFHSEAASLKAIRETHSVRVPEVHKVVDNPDGGGLLVLEYLDLKPLRRHGARLGEEMAKMHLHNQEQERLLKKQASSVHKHATAQYVANFGFHVPGCYGNFPLENTWNDDWAIFFIRNRLQRHIDLIEEQYKDPEIRTLWGTLMPLIPKLFCGLDVKPSLLHGDLWKGNVAEVGDEPVVFDPASYYGHHEVDICMATMFGNFGADFFDAYHGMVPKAPDFEKRREVYQLFYHLNEWNHFGPFRNRPKAVSVMKKLLVSLRHE